MKADPSLNSLFKNRQFLLLWASQLLSQLTINLVTYSILSHIYATTKSSIAVSFLWLAFSVPIFIFGPLAGSLVDRFDLRKTMYLTNMFQGLAVLLFLISRDSLITTYLLVFLYSAIDRLYIPAQSAAIPWLVSKPQLPAANGLLFLTQQASLLVGFGLGGIMVSIIGQLSTTILSAVFLFAASIAAYFLPHRQVKNAGPEAAIGFHEFLRDLVAGYKLLKTHPHLKFPMGIIVFLQSYITIVAILLPSFTYQTLQLPLDNAGALMIVPGALGALFASYYLPTILKKRRKVVVIQYSLLIAGVSLLLISLAGHLPVVSRLALIFVSAFSVGASCGAAMIPSNTFIQEKTPHEFAGRIYGLLGFFASVAAMIPLMAAASLADVFGAQIILGSLAMLLIFAFVLVKIKGNYFLRLRT